MVDEKVFLQNSGVLVSSSRVEINGQTFATRNIGSVKVTAPGISLLSILFLIIGVGAMAKGSNIWVGGFFLVVGAVWAWTTYTRRELKLMAGGGEVMALKSNNAGQVEQIRAAIADAIAVR